MARAKVKTKTTHRLTKYGYTFRNDAFVIISDDSLIARLKIDPQFSVFDIKIAELAAKPEVKDDFLKPEPQAPVEELKYHKLIAMKKEELKEVAYAMGAKFDDDSVKRDLVKSILDKQLGVEEELDEQVDEDEISN